MTLLEKAEALGHKITRRKVGSYPVYRIVCSTCFKPAESKWLPEGSNYNSHEIRVAMNDHARWHIAQSPEEDA